MRVRKNVCVREREKVCERVCVCVRERERECVSVCVCVCTMITTKCVMFAENTAIRTKPFSIFIKRTFNIIFDGNDLSR